MCRSYWAGALVNRLKLNLLEEYKYLRLWIVDDVERRNDDGVIAKLFSSSSNGGRPTKISAGDSLVDAAPRLVAGTQ